MKDLLRLYLESSREFSAQLAERTPGEVAYDGDVLAGLRQGLTIRGALDRAAQKHPQEALQADDAGQEDIREHYEYLKNHEDILAKFRGGWGAPNGGRGAEPEGVGGMGLDEAVSCAARARRGILMPRSLREPYE